MSGKINTMNLKYLFIAELADGSTYEQTPNDVSKQNQLRSAFYDIKDADIQKFTLVNTEKPSETVTVDLQDGSFIIKGKKIFIHGDEPENVTLKNFRLIYFRRNYHTLEVGSNIKTHAVRYYIGWQCTVNKVNYKKIIELE
jgi:hypothetical protein